MTTEIMVMLLQYHSQRCRIFFSWSIIFEYFFLSGNTCSTISLCWLSLYLQERLGT